MAQIGRMEADRIRICGHPSNLRHLRLAIVENRMALAPTNTPGINAGLPIIELELSWNGPPLSCLDARDGRL
jgi:hypothetical protein